MRPNSSARQKIFRPPDFVLKFIWFEIWEGPPDKPSQGETKMEGKKIWFSKILWLNVLALAAILVQAYTGYVVSVETQASILAVLNVLLRLITKDPIVWS
jgi:hypothetical protein